MTTIKSSQADNFEDFPERICDTCEKLIEGLPHLHWGEKDFDLCFPCLNDLHIKNFGADKDENSSKSYRKAQIPNVLRWKIWRRDNFTCQYCGVQEDLSIDHIFPESRGGGLVENNLVSSCKKCNSIKGNRTPEEAGMIITNDPRD
ncbi:HNH endonuclease [Oceanobacillus sp. CF4.6]|uniref:HNH endonuclease n=1 Tax=Oceanobacillus sp. CF4.6 TaxID=3373080 RepID=UPI003EE5BF13